MPISSSVQPAGVKKYRSRICRRKIRKIAASIPPAIASVSRENPLMKPFIVVLPPLLWTNLVAQSVDLLENAIRP